MSEQSLDETQKEANDLLVNLRSLMAIVIKELNDSQRRSFDTSDFLIYEFKRLSNDIEALIAQLQRFQ